jgi:hypothetical protein
MGGGEVSEPEQRGTTQTQGGVNAEGDDETSEKSPRYGGECVRRAAGTARVTPNRTSGLETG